MSFLEVAHLSKKYGRTRGVDDVSFDVESGSILGLVGPNGAGKSTLLKMLATVLRPNAGQIVINGRDAMSHATAIRRVIGYVPDVYGLPADVKVWEFLDLFARCHQLRGRVRQTTIAELLKLVDLFDFRFAYCHTLSRGMQQKLMVARALLNDPDLLLLDEPLAGMDPESRLETLEVLRELAAIGKTIVISSHAIGEMVDVCDRIGIMAEGHLKSLGTVPELIRELDPAQPVRLVVLKDAEAAQKILADLPEVSEVEGQGHAITFLCHGGQAALADVLRALVQAGVAVVQFGTPAQPVEDLISAAPRTEASREQSQP